MEPRRPRRALFMGEEIPFDGPNPASKDRRGARGSGEKRSRRQRRKEMEASRYEVRAMENHYDAILVLDFEATCLAKGTPSPQEIIEFPVVEVRRTEHQERTRRVPNYSTAMVRYACVFSLSEEWSLALYRGIEGRPWCLFPPHPPGRHCRGRSQVDPATKSVVSEFHSFVRPLAHPRLSEFCTELTGITQKQVDEAPVLAKVLQMVEEWMADRGHLDEGKRVLFVTSGRWDLTKALPRNVDWYAAEMLQELEGNDACLDALPQYYLQWHDLKDSFRAHYETHTRSFLGMLRHMNMELIGRHHSGIDDARNMARMVIRLLDEGYYFPEPSNTTSRTAMNWHR